MRLIDADKLISKIEERYVDAITQVQTRRSGKTVHCSIALGLNRARNEIIDQPTIDAVPVVRCRNCISFGKQPEHLRGVIRPDTGLCMYTWKLVLPEDFCSNAAEMDEDLPQNVGYTTGGAEDENT